MNIIARRPAVRRKALHLKLQTCQGEMLSSGFEFLSGGTIGPHKWSELWPPHTHTHTRVDCFADKCSWKPEWDLCMTNTWDLYLLSWKWQFPNKSPQQPACVLIAHGWNRDFIRHRRVKCLCLTMNVSLLGLRWIVLHKYVPSDCHSWGLWSGEVIQLELLFCLTFTCLGSKVI